MKSFKDNNMYIVKYSTGDWDDYEVIYLFVTPNKKKATAYVRKYNKLLKELKKHYKKMLKKSIPYRKNYDIHNVLFIHKCFYNEIECR